MDLLCTSHRDISAAAPATTETAAVTSTAAASRTMIATEAAIEVVATEVTTVATEDTNFVRYFSGRRGFLQTSTIFKRFDVAGVL